MLGDSIAREFGITVLKIRGPELLDMYVGESEKKVRQLFAQVSIEA